MTNQVVSDTSLYETGNKINELIALTLAQSNSINNKLNVNGTAANSNKLGGKDATEYTLKANIPSLVAPLIPPNRMLKSENVIGVTFNYDLDAALNKEVKITADTEFTFDNTPEDFVIPSSIIYIEAENSAKVTLSNAKWLVDEPDVTGKTKYTMILQMIYISNKWYVSNVSTEVII